MHCTLFLSSFISDALTSGLILQISQLSREADFLLSSQVIFGTNNSSHCTDEEAEKCGGCYRQLPRMLREAPRATPRPRLLTDRPCKQVKCHLGGALFVRPLRSLGIGERSVITFVFTGLVARLITLARMILLAGLSWRKSGMKQMLSCNSAGLPR